MKGKPAPVITESLENSARSAAEFLATLIYSYYSSLVDNGFAADQALTLSVGFQEHFLHTFMPSPGQQTQE